MSNDQWNTADQQAAQHQPSGYPGAGPEGLYPPAGHSAAMLGDPQPYLTHQPEYLDYTPQAQTNHGGIGSLFDFGFNSYATPTLIKIYYVLTVVASIAIWLGYSGLFFFIGSEAGRGGAYGFNPFPLFGGVTLLLGWIPALLGIMFTRFVCEFFMATIHTSEATRELNAKTR